MKRLGVLCCGAIVFSALYFSFSADSGDQSGTLAGIDADGDGVRDDVQEYIVNQKQLGSRKTKALLNYAMFYRTRYEVNTNDPSAVREYMDGISQAISCVFNAYGVDDIFYGSRAIDDISERMSNTRERKAVTTRLSRALPAIMHDNTNDENCP